MKPEDRLDAIESALKVLMTDIREAEDLDDLKRMTSHTLESLERDLCEHVWSSGTGYRYCVDCGKEFGG